MQMRSIATFVKLVVVVGENIVYFGICLTGVPISFVTILMSCTEKNVFENVFNIVMNIEGKTKDNIKSREDFAMFCRRKELEKNANGKYPKANYTLDKNVKQVVCEWVKNLKFPDSYVSNMGRCVDLKKYKHFGMNSHDCHVFM